MEMSSRDVSLVPFTTQPMGDPRGGSKVKWEGIVIGGLRGKALRMCELGSSAWGHACLKAYVWPLVCLPAWQLHQGWALWIKIRRVMNFNMPTGPRKHSPWLTKLKPSELFSSSVTYSFDLHLIPLAINHNNTNSLNALNWSFSLKPSKKRAFLLFYNPFKI